MPRSRLRAGTRSAARHCIVRRPLFRRVKKMSRMKAALLASHQTGADCGDSAYLVSPCFRAARLAPPRASSLHQILMIFSLRVHSVACILGPISFSPLIGPPFRLALFDHAFAWWLLPRRRDGCLGLQSPVRSEQAGARARVPGGRWSSYSVHTGPAYCGGPSTRKMHAGVSP